MKKTTILISILSILSITSLQAQWGWFIQNSGTNINLSSVYFINQNTGWAVGMQSIILKTTNGGASWSTVYTGGTYEEAYSIYFADQNTGYVAVDSTYGTNLTKVLKSTNGGINWIVQSRIQSFVVLDGSFIDQNTGWLVGDNGIDPGRIYKTTNGALSWTEQSASMFPYTLFTGQFINQSLGWVVGAATTIGRTTNGGANWVVQSNPSSGILNTVYFTDANTGWTGGSDDIILKSTNGGVNWFNQYSYPGRTIQSIYFFNQSTGWAASTGGTRILNTTNGGMNWSEQLVEPGANTVLYSLCFVDQNTGWAVGTSGRILKTTTGGAIVSSEFGWVQHDPGFGHSYNSVHFINAYTGMACGTNGAIIKSTNSGFNWINLTSGTSLILNDIKMYNTNVAIAVGDMQVIVRTTNGGQNWYVVNQSTISRTFRNVDVFNGTQAVAFSRNTNYPYDSGYVFKSTDLGSTWSNIKVNPCNVNPLVSFINMNTGWIQDATTGNPYFYVRRTTNGGYNWDILLAINTFPYGAGASSLYFYDSLMGFMSQSSMPGSVISRTLNGGYNWNTVTGYSIHQMFSFYFANSIKGWAVGYSSKIRATSDGGTTWVDQISPVSVDFKKVFFIDENTGWIAALSAGILRTTSGGISGVKKINSEIPQSFSLSQNFPNPFNPVTKIKYQIPLLRGVSEGRGVLVKLIIYDVLGREIETLVNQSQKPGSYEVTWDGSRYASGVYFYKLMTDEYVETRKMVLIK